MCHPEATDALEQQVGKLGDRSIGVEAGASRLADLQMLIDRAVSAFDRVDIMVSNAGVETRTSVLDTTEEAYDRVMAINLKSAFFGTGRIINITSVHVLGRHDADRRGPGVLWRRRRKLLCGRRRQWPKVRDYCLGLLMPIERKSVEPISSIGALGVIGRALRDPDADTRCWMEG